MNKNDTKSHTQIHTHTHKHTRSHNARCIGEVWHLHVCNALASPLSLAPSFARYLSRSLTLSLPPSHALSLVGGGRARYIERRNHETESREHAPPSLYALFFSYTLLLLLSLSARKRTHTRFLYPVQAQTLWRVTLPPTLAIYPDV
jgi:hypothetical protein